VFVVLGIGFYMLHASIQLHATDLTHTARGTALSLHSCAFFSGQAIGPIYYGFALGHFGTSVSMFIGAAVIGTIGLICARFLRFRRPGLTLAEGP
jgi:predicted MFS family arabinose efflux permease